MPRTFGEKLQQLRKDRGLTQADLAKLAGNTRGTVANWEVNRRIPEAKTMKLIASIFNVSMDYLCDIEPDAKDMSDFIGKAEMFFMAENVSETDKDAVLRDIMDLYFRAKNGGIPSGHQTKGKRDNCKGTDE